MSTTTAGRLPFQAIGILGCGLIGCSIAASLKKRTSGIRVIGCGRPGANLDAAAARGYVDAVERDIATAARTCDLFVVCTPVDRIVDDVRTIAANCRAGTLITDAGSVKQTICAPLASGLPGNATFIGSHPIAGSEKQGCEHASADLFVDHVCVITPNPQSPARQTERLAQFWRTLGMTVVEMTAEAHDRALAQTSHVPHVVAAALAASLSPENRALTGSGFHDTTRIAAGDPALWTAILMANAAESAAGLRVVSEHLEAFMRALEARDEKSLIQLLRAGKLSRRMCDDSK